MKLFRRLLCYVLDWHKAPEKMVLAGPVFMGKCPACERYIQAPIKGGLR